MNKVLEVLLLLFGVPLCALWLKLQQWFPWWGSRLPGSTAELLKRPAILLDLLQDGKQVELGPKPRFVSFVASGGADAEPDKNATVVKGVLTWCPDTDSPDRTLSRSIFVKMPTGRNISIWLKALGMAFIGQQREVGFYTIFLPWLRRTGGFTAPPPRGASLRDSKEVVEAAPASLELGVPVRVPKCLYAYWSRSADRTVLIFDEIDTVKSYECIPDWKGATAENTLALMSQVVSLHAATYRWFPCSAGETAAARAANPLCDAKRWANVVAVTSFVPETRGAEWLSGLVKLYIGKMSPAQRSVWDALCLLLHDEPVCASHGDCRPGNMLFAQPKKKNEGIGPEGDAKTAKGRKAKKRTPTPSPTRHTAAARPAKKDSDSDDAAAAAPPILTDWEAFSVTPYLWDCTYCMVIGLDTSVRRARHTEILRVYLDLLDGEMQNRFRQAAFHSSPGSGSGAVPWGCPTLSDAVLLSHRLSLVVYFFGWILQWIGGIGKVQGNTENDLKIWQQRVLDAVRDAFGTEEHFQVLLPTVSREVCRQFLHELEALLG